MAERAAYLADLMLVDRCLEGETSAARELFRSQQGRVQATLYRVLGSNSDMDDLLQDTFIQVFKSLGSFRGEAKLSTWIDRIAVRVAYRYLKKKKSRPVMFELGVDDGRAADDPHQQAAARAGVRRLYEVLAEMTPAARVAFALHEIEGRPLADVAMCVGASVTATKLRVWRARRALMKKAQSDPILADFLGDVRLGVEEVA